MMAVEELIVNMPLSRACNLIGIPRRTYYNRKRFRMIPHSGQNTMKN
ncbi:MAG: hypothetical protein ACYDAO_06735 [Thermoplasmataceae archaeon]